MAGPGNFFDQFDTPSQGGVVRLPKSAKQLAEEARAQAAEHRAQEGSARDAARLKISQGEAARRDAEWRATHLPNGAPKPVQQPKDLARLANLRALEQQIARVRELYGKGPGATKGLSSLTDYLPTPANKQFDAAAAGLGEMGLAAFRVPGVGSQSDAELRAFVDANRPAASDYDKQIEEKLRNLQTRLGQTYSAMGIGPQTARQAPGAPQTQNRVVNFNDLP